MAYKMSAESARVYTVIPKSLKDRAETVAEKEYRTLANLIAYALELYVSSKEESKKEG